MDRELFTSSWKMMVVRGAVGIVFGIVAIAWPIETGLALMVLWGFWALLEGISLLVQAVRSGGQGSRLGRALLGLLAVIVAFFAIFSPGVTAQTLTWIFGIWLIIRGVFEAFTAFSSYRLSPRWLLLVGAALSILLGVFFVANPGRGAVGIAVWLGLIALCWGVVFVVAGFLHRREHRWPAAPANPAPA
ncbi:HdeD family acid-resistance protein [Kribbella sp. NPDC051586]|uniref:HdeD family acid-resistance protein n=1 Tax=Kribbella sp. NPDC051586 TaxID=3364118 RepID=UPI003787B6DA